MVGFKDAQEETLSETFREFCSCKITKLYQNFGDNKKVHANRCQMIFRKTDQLLNIQWMKNQNIKDENNNDLHFSQIFKVKFQNAKRGNEREAKI